MAPSLIVLGWDSATFDVADPLVEAGRLPALATLIGSGFRAPLRSTWPPMTDCAWTSAFTGRNPGAHGIFGSWYRAPGAYACRYFSSSHRKSSALWEMTEGVRHLVWNVPMTYPANPIEGVMVAGYGAPPGARFCTPEGWQEELARRWPLDDLLDRAPHGSLSAFLDDLLRGLDAQAEALPWAVKESGADCVSAVWPHVDRAQHFFWRYRDTGHELAGAVDRVYEAMDRATAAVVESFPSADVLVVSDHGAGPLDGDVNAGAWLANHGFARYGRERARLSGIAWAFPPAVRRLARRAAPGLAQKTMAATMAGQLGAFDWPKTKAFFGFHSDLWLNLEGREPRGCVPVGSGDDVLEEICDGLLALEDPNTGRPVFAAAHKRDDIYSGPSAHMGPDAMLDSWSAGYRVAPSRGPAENAVAAPAHLAGVEEAWSSDHRPLGIFVADGPRIAQGSAPELALYDVCPTALALLEQAVPQGLDGRVAGPAIDPGWAAAHPVRAGAGAGERAVGGEYSDAEAEAVAEHLKDLGYIE